MNIISQLTVRLQRPFLDQNIIYILNSFWVQPQFLNSLQNSLSVLLPRAIEMSCPSLSAAHTPIWFPLTYRGRMPPAPCWLSGGCCAEWYLLSLSAIPSVPLHWIFLDQENTKSAVHESVTSRNKIIEPSTYSHSVHDYMELDNRGQCCYKCWKCA